MSTAPPAKVIKAWASEKQRWLVERGAAPTLLVGGINSGKTIGCVLKSLALLERYPGSRLGVVRRNFTQLTKTTMESWYQWCLPKMYDKGRRTEDVLTLNNGSRVYFLHLDQPNSLDVLAGLELNFVYVSQAEEISEPAWDLLDVRVGRWTGATIPEADFIPFGGRQNWPWRNEMGECVPPRYIYAEGYVTDEGHWLYRRFAEESPERERWAALGYECKIVWSEENKYAIKATVDASLAKDEDYVRKYVRPKWGNPEGKYFHVDEIHKLEPTDILIQKIQRTMYLHRALDHGETAPTCCGWFATDHDGNIFCYREYYQPDALISDHRQAIFELSKADGGRNATGIPRYHSNLADPTIINKNRGASLTSGPKWSAGDDYSDTRIMSKETAIWWQPSNNDPDATISRMKEYLRIDPNHKHPITGKMGAPRLYFVKKTKDYPNGCDKTIKEINAQQRKQAKLGDRVIYLDERDDKVVDHAYDMCKYFVISRPSLGPSAPPPPLAPGEIPIAEYEKAEKYTRARKRLEKRISGVAALGYGH